MPAVLGDAPAATHGLWAAIADGKRVMKQRGAVVVLDATLNAFVQLTRMLPGRYNCCHGCERLVFCSIMISVRLATLLMVFALPRLWGVAVAFVLTFASFDNGAVALAKDKSKQPATAVTSDAAQKF